MNNKENEGATSDQPMNVLSTRKNSLMQTMNILDPKQKRLKAFKQ